jgi:hypothetical protein
VNEIRIYVEGGGDKDSKARLREAFSRFLSEPRLDLQKRGIAWRVIPCGSREDTYDAFRRGSREHSSARVLLLVDAERPLTGTEREHLAEHDGWDLSFAAADHIHLMTQLMESWMLADPAALARFYGQGFAAGAIPKRHNVEEIPKEDVERALKEATRNTQPGVYHKTRHAPKILEDLDPATVRQRAPGCERLFQHLAQSTG